LAVHTTFTISRKGATQRLVERTWAHGCITFKKVLASTVEDAQKLKK